MTIHDVGFEVRLDDDEGCDAEDCPVGDGDVGLEVGKNEDENIVARRMPEKIRTTKREEVRT